MNRGVTRCFDLHGPQVDFHILDSKFNSFHKQNECFHFVSGLIQKKI